MSRVTQLTAVIVFCALSGCAAIDHKQIANEERAAKLLRDGGATEAGQAAESRLEARRQSNLCNDVVQCFLELVGAVVLGQLEAAPTKKR